MSAPGASTNELPRVLCQKVPSKSFSIEEANQPGLPNQTHTLDNLFEPTVTYKTPVFNEVVKTQRSSISLATDQQEAVKEVMVHQTTFVTGPAGTGKSVLIQYLTDQFSSEGRTVHLCSSTGVSAYLIGGITVHTFIIQLLTENPLTRVCLSPSDVVIIDEISMLGKSTYEEFRQAIVENFIRYSGHPDTLYKLIFVGDFAQLPPVNDEFCFTSDMWQIDKEIQLTEIKRQTEREFAEFLLRVRSGKLSMADRKRIHQYQTKPIDPESIQLYPTNERARQYNSKKLNECSKSNQSPIVTLPYKTFFNHNFSEPETEQFIKHQVARFYDTLTICEGAKVMLTSNLSVEEGWVNGSLCNVEKITEDSITLSRKESKTDKIVYLEIHREFYARSKSLKRSPGKCRVMVNRKLCDKVLCIDHAETVYTDKFASETELNGLKKENTVIVMQYPLLLSWAITIHKAQGSTLDSCTVHLMNMKYTPSLFYVALSRCKSEDKLALRAEGPIQYDQICPEEEIMKRVFGWRKKKCEVCQSEYIGPYKVCQECSSGPAHFTMKCFKDFVEKPTEEMLNFIEFALSHREYQQSRKWKKFIEYIGKEYKVK